MLCVTLPFKPAIVFHCGEGVGEGGRCGFAAWVGDRCICAMDTAADTFFDMQMRREA